ncbi:MAG: hypothetical protein QGI12_04210 [Acidimicrobiales bacterium]|nr:hypothetical protein [Acidimicrobiales bacterium]
MKVVGVGAIFDSKLGQRRVLEWGLDFTNIADTGEVWSKFGVINQPAFAVVTSEGNVLTHMGHLDLNGIFSLIEKAKYIS